MDITLPTQHNIHIQIEKFFDSLTKGSTSTVECERGWYILSKSTRLRSGRKLYRPVKFQSVDVTKYKNTNLKNFFTWVQIGWEPK